MNWPPDVKPAAHAGAAGDRAQASNDTVNPTIAQPEAPEHRNQRRAFLIWALMVGAVPPQRVVERVLDELNDEASP